VREPDWRLPRGSGERQPSSVGFPETSSFVVLLIEPDPTLRQHLSKAVGGRYRLITAADCEEGAVKAFSHRPDLIVADAEAVARSGRSVRQIAGAPESFELPLIVLGFRAGAEARVDAARVGASEYLRKPFAPVELIARIDTHLRVSEVAKRALESERLATLGLLASGFAHDVRNPLNGILNSLAPLRERVAALDSQAALSLIEIIDNSCRRVGTLAEMFLSLGRSGSYHGQVDLVESLETSLKALEHKLPRGVTVERRYLYGGPVRGHAAQLRQVWINLVDNAIRAVGKAGRIVVSTERVASDCLVVVSDSGGGIAPEHMQSLFQPFFSTRADGTGLGLALCRRIVLQHDGLIDVKTQLGKGTQFMVTLPLVDEPAVKPSRTGRASA